MRIAHISDFHLARPLSPYEFNLKRLLGRVNWILKRRRIHDEKLARERIAKVAATKPNAVIVTGDITQTGSREEFEAGMEMLDIFRKNGIPVLITDGNHDFYGWENNCVRRLQRQRQELSLHLKVSESGVAKLEDWEIILLSQAKATLPFMANGKTDENQIAILSREKLENRNIILAGHFPLLDTNRAPLPASRGLAGAEKAIVFIEQSGARAYLCGHTHTAFSTDITESCKQFCAGSLSMEKGQASIFECEDGRVKLVEKF